jgi:hypothetical protein
VTVALRVSDPDIEAHEPVPKRYEARNVTDTRTVKRPMDENVCEVAVGEKAGRPRALQEVPGVAVVASVPSS